METKRRHWQALRHHPVEVFLGLTMAVLSAFVLGDFYGELYLLNAIAPFVVVWLGVFAVSALHHLNRLSLWSRLLCTLALVAFGVISAHFYVDTNLDVHLVRWSLLIGAALAGLGLVPLLAGGDRARQEERLWRFGIRLGPPLLAGFLGLAALVLAIDFLGVGGEWPTLVLAVVAFLVVPWLLLAFSDKVLELETELPEKRLRLIATLARFLLLPLAFLFVLSILVRGALVLAGQAYFNYELLESTVLAGTGALFVLWLVSGFQKHPEHRSLLRVARFLPLLTLSTLPLALYHVTRWNLDVGWNNERYVLVLLLLSVGAACVLALTQIIRRRHLVTWPLSPLLLLLFVAAAYGPFSVVDVTRKSQLHQLAQAADEVGALTPDGEVNLEVFRRLARYDRARIQDISLFLLFSHGEEVFAPFAPADADLSEFARTLSARTLLPDDSASISPLLLTNDAGLPETYRDRTVEFFLRSGESITVRIDGHGASTLGLFEEWIWLESRRSEAEAALYMIVDRALAMPEVETLDSGFRTTPLHLEDGTEVGMVFLKEMLLHLGEARPTVESVSGYLMLYSED